MKTADNIDLVEIDNFNLCQDDIILVKDHALIWLHGYVGRIINNNEEDPYDINIVTKYYNENRSIKYWFDVLSITLADYSFLLQLIKENEKLNNSKI